MSQIFLNVIGICAFSSMLQIAPQSVKIPRVRAWLQLVQGLNTKEFAVLNVRYIKNHIVLVILVLSIAAVNALSSVTLFLADVKLIRAHVSMERLNVKMKGVHLMVT
jgi:hypothetical protein